MALFKELYLIAAIVCCVTSYDCDNGYCLPQAENFLSRLAFNSRRTLSVSSTCADQSAYVKYPDTGDATEFKCGTAEHSSNYMYDSDPTYTTYWQSENSVSSLGEITEQWVLLNLTDIFSIRSVLIGFTSPHVGLNELSDVRPKALAIERWIEEKQMFEAWQYYSSDCLSFFPNITYQPINGPPHPPTLTVCKEQYYSGDVTTRNPGRPYQFVLYSPFSDYSELYRAGKIDQDYFSTSSIRIRLVEPAVHQELASYYTISSLQINGLCLCYGHADDCLGENNAQCDCIHNTQGVNCEMCKPLYNAAKWQLSVSDQNSSCLRCDCNNNADSCVYNETTQEAVCVGCYGNSYGSRCEYCVQRYYNAGQPDGDTLCAECQCNGVGVISPLCDSIDGQCSCKNFVTGRSCDQCIDGYWNLTHHHNNGCQPCHHCDTVGSLGDVLPLCDKITGECKCKAYAVGDNCSECKPQTYNLTSENPAGCTSCGCLLGASLNLSCEYNMDNHCSCIKNVEGRTCDTPSPGYFIPKLDYIQLDLHYSQQIILSASGRYLVISSNLIVATLSTEDNITASFTCRDRKVQPLYNNSVLCLEADVRYHINSSDDAMLTFIPTFSDLLNSPDGQVCLHQLLDGLSPRSAVCTAIEYSVMSSVYGKALQCECDEKGSHTPHLCDPYSGQCYCKPGVTGRTCQTCEVNHYNFSSQGCDACKCHPQGSQEQACDDLTGACVCQPNVTGDMCDRCLPVHYGLSSGNGCSRCQCSQYALDNSCDDMGICNCLSGVGGSTCTTCLNSYYLLSEDGCLPCNCSNVGSINSTCSPAGTCSCKPFVSGDKCDTCIGGFHQLWRIDKPCKMCYCSGHTLQCSTQRGWSKMTLTDTWSLLNDSAVQPRWSVVDSDGRERVTSTRIYHSIADVQEVTEFTVTNASSTFYYKATDMYLGDLRSSYYQTFNFTISYQSTGPSDPLERMIVLRGASINYELLSVPFVTPMEEPTHYSLRFSEDNFIRNDTLRRTTLPSLLLLLNNVTEILIPANYDKSVSSTSRLYTVAMETGVRDITSEEAELSSVEQCICPRGYEGEQCEKCVDGFTRHPKGSESPTSQCVLCDCSGRSCDPVTGVCQCTGAATGEHCESCLPDHYGASASGGNCTQCMCYGSSNISCVLEVDGLPTCLSCSLGYSGRLCQVCHDGYFGNPPVDLNCVSCHCNGHSNRCDHLTGVCIGCEANTRGDNCELCSEGFYKDGNNSCTECSCDGSGYDRVCHPETGACQCLAGLDISYNCSRCLPGHYNLSTHGCLPCNCHTAGTLQGDVECNVTTGECNCVANRVGRDCSTCHTGYYDSNGLCVECNCSSDGAVNGSCDAVTGQCMCVSETVTGRACDTCLLNTSGNFPSCYPCGGCYDGWRQVLTELSYRLDETFHQLSNVSLLYGELTSEEIGRTLALIQDNITLSQDLYNTSSRLINATNDVKLSFLLLDASLNEISAVVGLLANQQSVLADSHSNLVNTFENSSSESLRSIKDKLNSSSSTKGLIDKQISEFEYRLSVIIHNLTSLRHANELFRSTASAVMAELTAVNASLIENSTVSHLLTTLENDTLQVLHDNTTLDILNTALERQGGDLDAVVMMVYNVSESTSTLRVSVLEAYNSAYEELMSSDSLFASALTCRQRVDDVVSAVSQHVASVDALKLELNKQWHMLNITEHLMIDINNSLSRVSELTTNISNTPPPSLQLIGSLLVSIQMNELKQSGIDMVEEEIELAVLTAEEDFNRTLSAESEIALVVEHVETALRDTAGAEIQLNKTRSIIDENFDVLQTSINHTLYKVESSIQDNGQRTSQVFAQLELFHILTNQIGECSSNSTDELFYLNVSAASLADAASYNEKILSNADNNKSQLFLRLQLQAVAVQSSQISLAESLQAYSGVRERIDKKRHELVDLLSEQERNEQRLTNVEQQLQETEEQLMSIIDGYRYPTESQCDD